jgi:peptidoglycan hydrolase-like protein with peptidoglycan-binding domain
MTCPGTPTFERRDQKSESNASLCLPNDSIVKRLRLFSLVLGSVAAFLPGVAAAETIKFAVIGDFGSAAVSHRVDDLIESWNSDFVITLGDNAYSRDPTRPQDRNAFEVDVVPSFGALIQQGKFFPSLGNHDYAAPGSGIVPKRVLAYLDTLKPPRDGPGEGRYYEFARGPVRFFALNSNGAHEPHGGIRFYDRQGDWLRARLAAATEPFKVVYFHHPPYTTSSENGPTKNMRWPFKEWGASLVLTGHEHNYERFDRRGLCYVVNGIGGARFYPLPVEAITPGLSRFAPYPKSTHPVEDRKHGAMLVEATDTSMELAMFTVKIVDDVVQGVERDRFTLQANTALPSPVYRDLRENVRGFDVRAWQDFLFERNLLGPDIGAVDGHFGGGTLTATEGFQREQGITVSGALDGPTREHARTLGFKPMEAPDPD